MKDLIERTTLFKAQAEKIRSVQGMLQRFRTLFNLPSAIRGNISKGEYDLAVREYRKAKSIVLPSHVCLPSLIFKHPPLCDTPNSSYILLINYKIFGSCGLIFCIWFLKVLSLAKCPISHPGLMLSTIASK